jgi:RNA polymerase sigma-70 factor (sigma-E family)
MTIYGMQYRSLVRLAVLLVGDVAAAEEAVQDSFIAMHGTWRRLQDRDKALSYLHQSVVNRSRSILRYRLLAGLSTPGRAPEMPAAGQGAIAQPERTPVIFALHALPPRQREALVLRFYLDLPEEQVASAMGISRGAVTRHTARAMAALSGVLKMAG